MADIKVRDLTDTSSVALDNQIMVLTNDAQNQVQNITVEKLLTNVLSSDNGNVLEQGTDGKLYVETPENITGNLADLDTVNKTSLVNSINEVVSNLSNEATTRANADNNLQSQIDAITSASDVTDIVGTYAQLQAYDTTGLPDNSIIKVLQDESRQNETTYYRWVITGGVGAWVLIGEEGPYYTKSQADSLFATQQTTGNLASLDTSDKTSLVNAINELSSVLDPTQTADYINNSKAVESGSVSSNSIILSNVIKYAHSTFDLSKFTVVGSPTITDGVASGFSSSGYRNSSSFITCDVGIDFTKKWEASVKAHVGNSGSMNLLFFNNGVDNKCYIYGSNNGISANIYFRVAEDSLKTPRLNVQINTDYIFKIGWDLTKYYIRAIKIDDGTSNEKSVASTTPIYNGVGGIKSIGVRYINNGWVWDGSIDLKQFSITVDGVEVFSGNKTGIDTIKTDDYEVVGSPTISADGIVSGFSTGNYLSFANRFTSLNGAYKICFGFETPSSDSTFSSLFSFKGADGNVGVRAAYGGQSGNKLHIQIDNNAQLNSTLQLSLNTNYIAEAGQNSDGSIFLRYKKIGDANWVENLSRTGRLLTISNITVARIGNSAHTTTEYYRGSIDLNAFKIYVDGNLVYQPCLKIPYTKGSEQYGGKYVNAQYLPRVKDAYEQGLANDYFTLDEVNGTYTLPMGNLYGMIEKLIQLAKDEIGLPKATLSNTLNDNEIWLEGAEVSKLTYSKLYAIYGDDYGTPTDSANFVLPDCRDRVMQGIGSGGTFGYIEAGLPNITGAFRLQGTEGSSAVSGAFSAGERGGSWGEGHNNTATNPLMSFDASRSSSIYGNSTTVQPPAIKVRFKTRFQ